MNHALVLAGFLGATGVAAGAFGAHALEALVTPAQLDIWSTAAQYHLIHALVVLVLALSVSKGGVALGPWPVTGFTSGVVLFSFSLYAYVLTGVPMFAMVTPLGGTVLILSWLLLVYRGVR
jgi:uncharacterized membrane protein YgdD (TMEM256/DUF423 family)